MKISALLLHRFLLICFFPWWWALLFVFLRGDVGGTIRGWIFPNLFDRHCMERCFWVGLRSGLACTSLPVTPSGNISPRIFMSIYIYISISYYIFYPIITGYIAFVIIGGHLWCFPKPPICLFQPIIFSTNSKKHVFFSGATSQRSSSFWMCWRRDAFGLLEDRKSRPWLDLEESWPVSYTCGNSRCLD